MTKTKERVLAELKGNVIELIDMFNKALKDNDLKTSTSVETQLKDAEKEYASHKATMVYDEMAKAENPIKAAIIKLEYEVLGHKLIKEDGVVIGMELVEDKIKQIDLVAMCKYLNIDNKWQYKVEKFNQLLCLRAANELKCTKEEIKKICDSYYMDKLATEIDLGGTPTSNTQICKQLQLVLDAMVFEEDEKGKNMHKALNRDVAFLLMCYTRKGKKALAVTTAKHSVVHGLIMIIAHRIITDKLYDLEYKTLKEKTAEKPEVKAEFTEDETVVEK